MACPNLPRLRLPRSRRQRQGTAGRRTAELRKVAPIWWNEQPIGKGGFNDGGYWVMTKHKDVKEVSLRSDVFSSWQNGSIPRGPTTCAGHRRAALRHAQHGRTAPHPAAQDHLARFHPAGDRRLQDELNRRAQSIAKAAAAKGSSDFVEQVSCELPLQAIAGLLGVPQEDRGKLFRWSNEMTGGEDPSSPTSTRDVLGRTDHVRHEDGRDRGKNPATTSSRS